MSIVNFINIHVMVTKTSGGGEGTGIYVDMVP
jgi:hypothetical protein